MRCTLCGKEIGLRDCNNASPFVGYCCNECNLKKVVPTRYALSKGYALLFKAPSIGSNGGIDVISNPEKLSLEELQERVEGDIEVVNLSDGYIAIVNEEGRLLNLPVNRVWKKFEYSEDYPQPFVGNVLFMRKEQLK